jgi:hypothetical protein
MGDLRSGRQLLDAAPAEAAPLLRGRVHKRLDVRSVVEQASAGLRAASPRELRPAGSTTSVGGTGGSRAALSLLFLAPQALAVNLAAEDGGSGARLPIGPVRRPSDDARGRGCGSPSVHACTGGGFRLVAVRLSAT